MSDLKGQEIRDSYQDLLTKGSGTAIEDGDGNSFIGAIVDNLTSTATNAPLSANQGKQLQDTKVAKGGDTMSGLLRLTAGLNFNASGGDTLSDYEVGTYNPVIYSATASLTINYTTQIGEWVRFGKFVYVFLSLNWNSFSGGDNAGIRVTYPFVPKISGGFFATVSNLPLESGYTFFTIQNGGDGGGIIRQIGSGQERINVSSIDVPNNGSFEAIIQIQLS